MKTAVRPNFILLGLMLASSIVAALAVFGAFCLVFLISQVMA